MTPSEAIDYISKQKDKIVAKEALNMFSELEAAAPVKTGNFLQSWESPKRIKGGWKIINTALYAEVLWAGRRYVDGRWYGSEDWKNGGEPILQKYRRKIKNDFDKVKV